MRILFCNYEYPPLGGGGGVVNALLAEELAKRHEVAVLTSQGLGLPAEEERNGVRVHRVPVFFRRSLATANLPSMLAYLPMAMRRGRVLQWRNHFDVINTHFVLPTGPVGQALADAFEIPNVLSVHGGDLYDPSKWTSPHRHAPLRRWVRQLLRRADQVVGQSTNTIDNLHRYYDDAIAAERIPLGIRRPTVQPLPRRYYGLPDDAVVLVTVGRLVARKAVDQLIRMVAGLAGAHLLVIGSGPQEVSLREQAEALGVAGRVHLMGAVDEDDKFTLLRLSDLYVSTSQHEGFGLVFLEAMACGLPVVCYDHGGQADFLEDGRTGHVVPLNDLERFGAACRALLEQPRLRQAMGAENGRRVEALYIDRCAERYEAVFEAALRRAGRPLPVRAPAAKPRPVEKAAP